MKKSEVMAKISDTRLACESANARLRATANVVDPNLVGNTGGSITRPTTERERKEAIIEAYLWASAARRRAERAAELALAYAKQNGVTVDEINNYGRRP